MPIGFIIMAIFLFYLLAYKNAYCFKISRVFLIIVLMLLLLGYFIKPINIADYFSINILFSFGMLFLAVEMLTSVKNGYKITSILLVLVTGLSYYLITLYNNDYLSFFNYIPIFLVITVLSFVFIKNLNAGIGFILLSYLAVEFLNYFIFNNNIGYLQINSYVVINYACISVLLLTLLNILYNSFSNNKIKKHKEVKR